MQSSWVNCGHGCYIPLVPRPPCLSRWLWKSRKQPEEIKKRNQEKNNACLHLRGFGQYTCTIVGWMCHCWGRLSTSRRETEVQYNMKFIFFKRKHIRLLTQVIFHKSRVSDEITNCAFDLSVPSKDFLLEFCSFTKLNGLINFKSDIRLKFYFGHIGPHSANASCNRLLNENAKYLRSRLKLNFTGIWEVAQLGLFSEAVVRRRRRVICFQWAACLIVELIEQPFDRALFRFLDKINRKRVV